eukprot:1161632-Pelagomonas_calceolata.AAC.5
MPSSAGRVSLVAYVTPGIAGTVSSNTSTQGGVMQTRPLPTPLCVLCWHGLPTPCINAYVAMLHQCNDLRHNSVLLWPCQKGQDL